MAVVFNRSVDKTGKKTPMELPAVKKLQRKPSSHSRALPIDGICFSPDKPSRLRVGHLMTLFGISHSGLYKMIRDGRIPKPDGHYGSGKRPPPFWLTSSVDPSRVIACDKSQTSAL